MKSIGVHIVTRTWQALVNRAMRFPSVVLTVVGLLVTPLRAHSQTLGVGGGLMVPVGENRSSTDRSQSLLLSVVMPTSLSFARARVDAGVFRARSKLVPGAVATTVLIGVSGVLRPPRITSLYGMAGAGVYRSSLSPAPMHIRATADFGWSVGAGLDLDAGSRIAGRAGMPWLTRVGVFLDSRLHHVLTDVKPTDFVELTVGIRLRLRA